MKARPRNFDIFTMINSVLPCAQIVIECNEAIDLPTSNNHTR